jgi:DNA invertase Pin-like site-specific DNA recombinase
MAIVGMYYRKNDSYELVMEYGSANGINIEKKYFEESGTRAVFNQMLCDIRTYNIETLLVYRVEELALEVSDLKEIIKAISEAGVSKIVQTIDGTVLDGYFLDNKLSNDMTSLFDEADIFNPLYHLNGKRVAIYHLSLDPIRSGCIELQMNILRKFAKEKRWEIVVFKEVK